jgi:hypothetical protein
VRVEGIVLPAHGNEAAEAESSQDSARALVLVRGEEGSAQLVFQFWVEPGAGHDRLYRVRARGFDHAQLLPEGRPPGAVSERRSSRSPLSPPRPDAPPRWSSGGTRSMIRCRRSSRLCPTRPACSASRSSRSASTRRCTPTSSLGGRRKFEPGHHRARRRRRSRRACPNFSRRRTRAPHRAARRQAVAARAARRTREGAHMKATSTSSPKEEHSCPFRGPETRVSTWSETSSRPRDRRK